ncbi:hypothetical protein CHGG_01332 [Chaetomium globosum CBS 148.51]|uniref:Uncharacterized protein n=1 Tax=Chaetomium globosum (strain ATCC 6205 / CBS 148.51 / DSM 1962 / NBRC 6347 / NRRL 1970) TaxID=306901 RepID=Q2HEM2_CHAGB|nr:uncharacterized protein CHGG_01332 [Chaetomium globosum CBS 148.51]EAQ93097.1 hypothetical protein CHGG_01332 [Chaetomium globosum CBS 148.51]
MHQYACLVSLLPLVAAHGFLSSPPARRPGAAYRATCGEQPFYQQSSDINGNVQGIQQVVGSDATEDCNLWLCKGFLLEDNPDQVQSYSLGQTIDITVNIAAPHTGYANVSVVKTSTNTMIGNPLIEFQNYASNSGPGPPTTQPSVSPFRKAWAATAQPLATACSSGSGMPRTLIRPTRPAPTSSWPLTGMGIALSSTSTVPVTTASAPATATSVDPAPATTTTAVPGTPDDECPADDGGDEGEDEDDEQGESGEGDEECPVDGGEEPEEDDDSTDDDNAECPADDGDNAAATTSLGAKDVSTSAAATPTGSHTSTVTQIVTSTVTTERLVTVTAAATACN